MYCIHSTLRFSVWKRSSLKTAEKLLAKAKANTNAKPMACVMPELTHNQGSELGLRPGPGLEH